LPLTLVNGKGNNKRALAQMQATIWLKPLNYLSLSRWLKSTAMI